MNCVGNFSWVRIKFAPWLAMPTAVLMLHCCSTKNFPNNWRHWSFVRTPLEPCVFILESGEGSQRKLHGALGVHVDDGVGGGDEYFHQQIQALSKVLPFGSFKTRKFVFTGIELEQLPDSSIRASQADYVHRILPIDIGKPRREQASSPVTDSEKSKLRGLVGSLQYAVTHTRPDLAAKLGEVQTDMSNPTVQTLMQCNKVLREAQEHSDVQICFRSIPMSQVTHVSFGDASFASPKQLNSFQGTLICATTVDLQENREAPISPLSWSSKKIARVVRSTLSAEAYSMSRSADRLGWLRLLWGCIHHCPIPMERTFTSLFMFASWYHHNRLPKPLWLGKPNRNAPLWRVPHYPWSAPDPWTVPRPLHFQMDPNDHHAGRCTDQGDGPISPKNCTPEGDVLPVWWSFGSPTKCQP